MSRGRSVCPFCHAGVTGDAAFCPTCGTALGPVLVTDADDPAATATPEVVLGRRSTRRQWWPWAALVAAVLLTRAITSAGHEGGDAPTIGDAAAASTSTTEPSTTIYTDPTTTTSLPQRLTSGNGPLLGERTGLELWINAFFQGADPWPTGVFRIDLDTGSIDRVAQGLTFDRGPDRSAVVTADGLQVSSNESTILVRRNGNVTLARFESGGQVVVADAVGVWIARCCSAPNEPTFTFTYESYDGRVLRTIDVPMPSPPGGVSGNGRLVVYAPDGRNYLLRLADGSATPASGRVLAMSEASTAYVAIRCSETMACGIDHVAPDGAIRRLPVAMRGFEAAVDVSPDGTWVVYADSGKLTALNPFTGESVTLVDGVVALDERGRVTLGWSQLGWVFFGADNGIGAWRPGLSDAIIFPVGDGTVKVDLFAVGPSPTST